MLKIAPGETKHTTQIVRPIWSLLLIFQIQTQTLFLDEWLIIAKAQQV